MDEAEGRVAWVGTREDAPAGNRLESLNAKIHCKQIKFSEIDTEFKKPTSTLSALFGFFAVKNSETVPRSIKVRDKSCSGEQSFSDPGLAVGFWGNNG
jgi:hypothetical protein